jgi:hypothetical protein
MNSKINLPGFAANTNIIQSTKSLRQKKTNARSSHKAHNVVIPAWNCSDHNCYEWGTLCFFTGGFGCEPFRVCCTDSTPATPGICDYNPCQPGCPPNPECAYRNPDYPYEGGIYGLSSDSTSELLSQFASLKRQLNRIERCTCGLPSVIYNIPQPSISYIPKEYAFSPNFPIPPSPY